jgi:hypothetical protein
LPLKAADAHSCKLVSKHSGPRFGVSRPAAHWNALICRGQRGTLRGHPHVPRGGALADECVCSPHVPPRAEAETEPYLALTAFVGAE